MEILVDETAEGGHTYTVDLIDMRDLNALIAMVGDLEGLSTTEKDSLVAAINELAANAGGSDYTLPIGGAELGGVKNGGNVTINADGTMTAPESEVTDEQVATAVSDWLEANPDATTTVQDGAITEEKLADGAVTYTKTAFATPNARLAKSERIVPYAGAYNGYAGNNQYFGYYYVSSDTTSIYATPVKAGQTYTIWTTSDVAIKFCTAYTLEEPSEEIKAVWSQNSTLLYKPAFTGLANLASRYAYTYNDRQTKIRFTPTVDGYILAPWFDAYDVFIYEGASPFVGLENWLDDAEGAYTMTDAPLYYPDNMARMPVFNRVEPDYEMQRLLRRGEYYSNLICSSMQMISYGDSITFGSSVGVGNRYHDFLRNKLGFELTANGVNGATVTTGYGMDVFGGTGVDGFIAKFLNATLDVLPNDNKPYRWVPQVTGTHYVFTIALGTNDWIYNAPLGTYDEAADYDSGATYAVGAYCTYNGDQYICTKAVESAMEFDATYWSRTFFGCYKKLITRIRELQPKAAIILITPWQQFYNDIHYNEPNAAGHSVLDYNLAIHEIAMMTRNCWVMDMMNSAYIREKDNSPSGTYVDGVHIGRKAHILVAHELEKILMQVVMMNGYDYIPLSSLTDSFTGQK